MTEIALRYDAVLGGFDIALNPATGDLVTDDGLTTAVMISLFTDARASADDPLPEPSLPRRGSWGDALDPANPWGSKLWLLVREKCTAETAARARAYAAQALQWLIADRIAARIDVTAAAVPAEHRIALAVTLTRPAGEQVIYRWRNLWAAMSGGLADAA